MRQKEQERFFSYVAGLCFERLQEFELVKLNQVANLQKQIRELQADLERENERLAITRKLQRGKGLPTLMRVVAAKGADALPLAVDTVLRERRSA